MVVLSLSRASLAIFAVGSLAIIGLLVVRHLTVKRVTLASLLIVGGAFVLLLAMDSIMGRFNSATDGKTTHDLLWILNEMSREMLEDHPLGVGWNNYGVINSRPYKPYSEMLEAWESNKRGYQVNPSGFYKNPLTESLYWCVLAEVGYAGFFGYLLFLIFTYKRMIQTCIIMRGTFVGTVLLGMLITFALLYVHSSVERILTQTKNLATWMLVLGMLAKMQVWSREVEPQRPIGQLFSETRQFLKWLTVDTLLGAGRDRRSMTGAR